jgi:protein tyrosine phosphatase (PTP) superfamily phosphohydrolase (DUF442 family)
MRRPGPIVDQFVRLIFPATAVFAAAAVLSCAASRDSATEPAPVASPETVLAAEMPIDNLHRVTDTIWSGPVPDSDAALAALEAVGVRTVISVDAATPDLERLRAYNMRSVHLPIRYAGIEPDRQIALARAVRDAAGPVYIHCHHGKHRGPAAAATAAVLLGDMTPDEGEAFLILAGTSASYPGLFQCVREARPVDTSVLDAWTGTLPEVAQVADLPAVMARIGSNFEMLDRLLERDLNPLPDHPDRTALSEAASMYDAFRVALKLTELAEPRFIEELGRAAGLAEEIETSLRGNDLIRADAAFMRLNESCARCHDVYRGSGMGW